MNDLERYLKQASRGLPRRERERVREELRSSILERAAEHQVGGANESEALKLALTEFGDPAPLGAGMRRIHLWPQVGFLGGLAAVTLSLVILNWPNALGQQVQVTTEGLVPRCTRGWQPKPGDLVCNVNQTFWVELKSLKEQLVKQGVTLTTHTETFRLPTLPGLTTTSVQETRLRATWTEGDKDEAFDIPITAQREETLAEYRRAWARKNIPQAKGSIFPPVEAVFQRGNTTYLDAHYLLSILQDSSSAPLMLEKPLDGPVLHLGRLALNLGASGQQVNLAVEVQSRVTRLLYQQYGATVYSGKNYLPRPDSTMKLTSGFLQMRKVRGQPGEVYAVLFPVTGNGVNGLNFDMASVDGSGNLNFRTPKPTFHFTEDIRALAQAGEGKAVVALLRLGHRITLDRDMRLTHQVEVP